MFYSWGRSASKRTLVRIAAAALVAGAVGLLGSSASTAATSTTWTLVPSNCSAPPPGPSGNWVQKGNGCWDQNVSYGGWTVNDGSASDTHTSPTFTVDMAWALPGSIGSAAGDASLSVMTTGMVSQRICVLQAYTSFTVTGGDSCAATSGATSTASAAIQPMDAADGTLAYVWISLGDGGNLFYTYKASTPAPKCSPPPGFIPSIAPHSAPHAESCSFHVSFDVKVDYRLPDSPGSEQLPSQLLGVSVESDRTKLEWDGSTRRWTGQGKLFLTTDYFFPVIPGIVSKPGHITLDLAGPAVTQAASYSHSAGKRLVSFEAQVRPGDRFCGHALVRVAIGVAKHKAVLKIAHDEGTCLSRRALIWRTDRIRTAHVRKPEPGP